MPSSARSLSAVTWAMVAKTQGFDLLRHNVFFSGDYAGEFDDIFRRGQLPAEPTVYVCAQDRDDQERAEADSVGTPETLLCLVNAPPTGDSRALDPSEIAQCEERTFRLLERCGLHITRTRRHHGEDHAERISSGSFRQRAARCTGRRRTDGWPRSDARVRAAGCRAFIWRAAARIRDRECRWRRFRASWRRQRCSRISIRRARSRPAVTRGGMSTR